MASGFVRRVFRRLFGRSQGSSSPQHSIPSSFSARTLSLTRDVLAEGIGQAFKASAKVNGFVSTHFKPGLKDYLNKRVDLDSILQNAKMFESLASEAHDQALKVEQAIKALVKTAEETGVRSHIDEAQNLLLEAVQARHYAGKAYELAQTAGKHAHFNGVDQTPATLFSALDEVVVNTEASARSMARLATHFSSVSLAGGAVLVSTGQEENRMSTGQTVVNGVLTTIDYGLATAETVECVATLGLGCAVDAGLEYALDKTIEVTAPIVVPVAGKIMDWSNQAIETVGSGVSVAWDEAGKKLRATVGTKLEAAFNEPANIAKKAINPSTWGVWANPSP